MFEHLCTQQGRKIEIWVFTHRNFFSIRIRNPIHATKSSVYHRVNACHSVNSICLRWQVGWGKGKQGYTTSSLKHNVLSLKLYNILSIAQWPIGQYRRLECARVQDSEIDTNIPDTTHIRNNDERIHNNGMLIHHFISNNTEEIIDTMTAIIVFLVIVMH